jgi:hypothetical protein
MAKKTAKVNQDELDLQFFIHIHKRKPKNKDEFELFKEKLSKREQKHWEKSITEFTEENFYETYTAFKGRENPFIETQLEYDGRTEDE